MKRRMMRFLKDLHADTHDCVECENLRDDREDFEKDLEKWVKKNDEQSID